MPRVPISAYLSFPSARTRTRDILPAGVARARGPGIGRLAGRQRRRPHAVVCVCARRIVRLGLRVNRHVHDGNVNQACGGSRTLRSVLMSPVLPDR